MENIIQKVLAAILPALMSVYSFIGGFIAQPGIPRKVEIPDTPGQQFVDKMNVGWNMGNTLDAYHENEAGMHTETMWGNPKTTEAMILKVKEAGFNTVRLPVTWSGHLGGAPDYLIDTEWLDRVQEVVDYAYNNGMYVILNSHHDNHVWFQPDDENFDASMAQYVTIWKQICARFADYGERLVLESMNEPRVVDSILEWSGGSCGERENINRLNEIFVRTVRESGGYNAERYLLLPTYAASATWVTLNSLRLPEDDKLIVSIHAYYPNAFAMSHDDAEWGSAWDKFDLEHMLATLYSTFVKKGIPVYMGEFGAEFKHNDAERARWADFYVRTAKKYGIHCAWWDNGLFTTDNAPFGLLNRNTLEWEHSVVVDTILKASR